MRCLCFGPILIVWTLCTLASVAQATDAREVRFTRKPTAVKTAQGLKIDFAVSAPTDVAVFIEDASGKVICHLVAGVLGKNPLGQPAQASPTVALPGFENDVRTGGARSRCGRVLLLLSITITRRTSGCLMKSSTAAPMLCSSL